MCPVFAAISYKYTEPPVLDGEELVSEYNLLSLDGKLVCCHVSVCLRVQLYTVTLCPDKLFFLSLHTVWHPSNSMSSSSSMAALALP